MKSLCDHKEAPDGICSTCFTTVNSEKVKFFQALDEISKGIGSYNTDKLTHAENTIVSMKDIALTALGRSTDHLYRD